MLGGKPTTAGSYSFTIIATDNFISGLSGSQQYTLTVNPASTLTLGPTPLPGGAVSSTYWAGDPQRYGGSGTYTFALARSSSLPAGLSLSTGGILNGQPTIAGTYQFTVTATDSSNHNLTGTLKYSLTVNPALAIGPAALSTATVGDLFHTQLTATGGSGKSYTFTASDLPSGLTLSATGLLSGTPTSNTGSPLKFTVTVGDSNGSTASHNYTLTVDPALAISPATLAVATVGNKVSKQLTATGGSEKGYTFTASGLPSWLTLTSAGLLSGTPTTATTSPLQYHGYSHRQHQGHRKHQLHADHQPGLDPQPQHAAGGHRELIRSASNSPQEADPAQAILSQLRACRPGSHFPVLACSVVRRPRLLARRCISQSTSTTAIPARPVMLTH